MKKLLSAVVAVVLSVGVVAAGAAQTLLQDSFMDGTSPLPEAIRAGHVDIVKILLPVAHVEPMPRP